MHSRRKFICSVAALMTSLLTMCKPSSKNKRMKSIVKSDVISKVLVSINGTPDQNIKEVIKLLGGIEKVVGSEDIVIIKPNLQWWNQGAPSIAACNTLIEMIMNRPGGFSGEVIIGENTHRGNEPWTKTGWATTFERNNDLPGAKNYDDLCKLLKKNYDNHFSVSHWIDVSAGGKRVYGPQDGNGYVYCDGTGGVPLISMSNGLDGAERREVIMSYPIFTTDNGTVIDFKNGVWKDGSYTDQPVKFINLAALNHHSTYCGMTSAVKNYFGITDISNGADPEKGGKLCGNFYNFHSFAFNEWANGPVPGIMGKEVGFFMNKIRKADLNITTAEWVGLISRTDKPVAHTKAVLASTDPVALDYHSAKYLLLPNSGCKHHDPDWKQGPLYRYLSECAEITGYNFGDSNVADQTYDFDIGQLQKESNSFVYGKINWGSNIKTMLKYLLFRFGHHFLN